MALINAQGEMSAELTKTDHLLGQSIYDYGSETIGISVSMLFSKFAM
jgi:hypothetical protein